MPDYARLLEAQIPRLRRYARALTRGDVERADDLVQNCLIRAVAKEHLWQPGTDLRAWLFTILHNQCQSALKFDPGSASNLDPCSALGQVCPGSQQEGPARSGATAGSLA
jgi:RNA polymerase sigma-70 factor (ECF subfamily)